MRAEKGLGFSHAKRRTARAFCSMTSPNTAALSMRMRGNHGV